MVSWFAGLFYTVRLFIYFKEADDKVQDHKAILQQQYLIMLKRLWWIITTPAMVLTVFFGIWMIMLNPKYLLSAQWMHLKLVFVALLLVYHFYCQLLIGKCSAGNMKWKSSHLRIYNEVATLFLVSIVFIVILKSQMTWLLGSIGFFSVGFMLMLGINIYKKLRKK